MFGLIGKYQFTQFQNSPFYFQKLPKYYFLFNSVICTRSAPILKNSNIEEFKNSNIEEFKNSNIEEFKNSNIEEDVSIFDNVKERRYVGALVIDAFRSEFRSEIPDVKKLYPYILQIPAPPTPIEFLEMEKQIVRYGNAQYLKTGGFLTPYEFTVPSIDGTDDDKCSLTRYPVCARFKNLLLNTFMVDLFEAIANETGKNGIPQIDLTRYDLFHGHFFLDYAKSGVGIIFHSKEYPKINDTDFPYNLGFCQQGSDLEFTPYVMNHRNILWFKGQLGVLNVDPEGALDNLVWELLRPVDTVLESDLGECPADVNFFQQIQLQNQNEKLFIC